MRSAGGDGRRGRPSLAAVAVLVCAVLFPPAAAAKSPFGSPPTEALTAPAMPAAPGAGLSRARRSSRTVSLTPSESRPYWACPDGACEAIIDPKPVRVGSRLRLPAAASGAALQGSGAHAGLAPADLQWAYKIPTSGGDTQTIAVIDAHAEEEGEAEKELAKYRKQYSLGACKRKQGCFRQVNEHGEDVGARLLNDPVFGWQVETMLDLEMASAACPHCHILLVGAESEAPASMAEAVNTAARLGATEISNSYGYPEHLGYWCASTGCREFAGAYDHPGVFITASSGDSAYEDGFELESAGSVDFPAAAPTVVSVGGTTLARAGGERGWSETVWPEGGGGCSAFEPKPAWQTDNGCGGRTESDVAAVSSCQSPVSVYLKGKLEGRRYTWLLVCGTSVAAPLIAGIEAHASAYTRSLGAQAFYAGPQRLFDVSSGSNAATPAECTPPAQAEYLCVAQSGYDGPTGNGTPDGPLEVPAQPPVVVTEPPADLHEAAITLDGRIVPDGASTSYRFELGTDTSYGTTLPVGEGAGGSGTDEVPVQTTAPDLTAGTTYHYRLVATNTAGTTYGKDESFTTSPPVVEGVQPATGPDRSGATITITGTGLAGASAVEVGGAPSPGYHVVSDSLIQAITPTGTGAVDVTVTTAAGTSAVTGADVFTHRSGEILTWGYDYGGFGTGRTPGSYTPVEGVNLTDVTELSPAGQGALGLMGDGSIESWGDDQRGQTGNAEGAQPVAYQPLKVCALGLQRCPEGPYLQAAAVATGKDDAFALLPDGTVASWGNAEGGALGRPPSTTSGRNFAPERVCLVYETPCRPENYLSEVVAIATSGLHSLALLKDGTVMAWGENTYGQLGDGTTEGPDVCFVERHAAKCAKEPVPVEHLTNVKAIAAGLNASYAVLDDGTVRAWGRNAYGELGDGTTQLRDIPVAVCATGEKAPCHQLLEHVAAVAASALSADARLADGTVRAWGMNLSGQLGDGSPPKDSTYAGPEQCLEGGGESPCSRTPVVVAGLGEVMQIAMNVSGTSYALLAGNRVRVWGPNFNGELGDGLTPGAQISTDLPVPLCGPYELAPCAEGSFPGGDVAGIYSAESNTGMLLLSSPH